MSWPTPYLSLPGTAREALTFYRSVFGGELFLYTLAEFQRTDGPPDAIAHGELQGRVSICASDSVDGTTFQANGLQFALTGTEPELLRGWFDALAEGGTVRDQLQLRPWGDWDGSVTDRYGLTWLVGFKGDAPGA